jgi:hypothetical protein
VCHTRKGWPRGGEPPSCGWTKTLSRQQREDIRPTHHNKQKVMKPLIEKVAQEVVDAELPDRCALPPR